jgi:hypothetical protein
MSSSGGAGGGGGAVCFHPKAQFNVKAHASSIYLGYPPNKALPRGFPTLCKQNSSNSFVMHKLYIYCFTHVSYNINRMLFLLKAHEIHLVPNFTHIYLLHEKMNKNTQKNVLVLNVPPQVSHQQLEHRNNEIVTHQNESKRTQTQTQNVIG